MPLRCIVHCSSRHLKVMGYVQMAELSFCSVILSGVGWLASLTTVNRCKQNKSRKNIFHMQPLTHQTARRWDDSKTEKIVNISNLSQGSNRSQMCRQISPDLTLSYAHFIHMVTSAWNSWKYQHEYFRSHCGMTVQHTQQSIAIKRFINMIILCSFPSL